MEDGEVEALFDQLVTVLSSRRAADQLQGNDDYLTPILAEIEAGKSVPIKLKVPSEGETIDPIAGRRTGGSSSAEFLQRQDFSGREKIEILLRGIEIVLIAPSRMAAKIVSSFDAVLGDDFDGVLQFSNDVATAPTRTVDPGSLIDTAMPASKLETIIREIRTELAQPREATV